MTQKMIPLKLDGISENIYGGFWLRLGSTIIDILIFIPLFLIMHYLHSLDKNYQILSSIVLSIFGFWYHVYLPKKYGGTPGKLISGIQILKINGESIGLKEALLRELVTTILGIFSTTVLIYCVLKANNDIYLSKSWERKALYLSSFAPKLFNISIWVNNIWMYSELIVLLLNKRKRALHDYIAGTVIVKSKYIDAINLTMEKDNL